MSWLSRRPLDRNSAISAINAFMPAETVARLQQDGLTKVVDHQPRLWPLVDNCAAALGLTVPDAVARVSEMLLSECPVSSHRGPIKGSPRTPGENFGWTFVVVDHAIVAVLGIAFVSQDGATPGITSDASDSAR